MRKLAPVIHRLSHVSVSYVFDENIRIFSSFNMEFLRWFLRLCRHDYYSIDGRQFEFFNRSECWNYYAWKRYDGHATVKTSDFVCWRKFSQSIDTLWSDHYDDIATEFFSSKKEMKFFIWTKRFLFFFSSMTPESNSELLSTVVYHHRATRPKIRSWFHSVRSWLVTQLIKQMDRNT